MFNKFKLINFLALVFAPVFNIIAHDNLTIHPMLMAGAVDEDDPLTHCLAHFYSPIPISGIHALTDPVGLGGRDSFEWASTGASFSPVSFVSSGVNQESWIKARKYYLDALTKDTMSLRDENFAHTFYALGKVSHLLQDLSQPDHVRNDAHLINLLNSSSQTKSENSWQVGW